MTDCQPPLGETTLVLINDHCANSLRIQEGLDMALAISAMGQPVAMAFKAPTNFLFRPKFLSPGARDLRKNLKALPIYGIERLYLEQSPFIEQNPNIEQNPLCESSVTQGNTEPFIEVSTKQLGELLASCKRVLTF